VCGQPGPLLQDTLEQLLVIHDDLDLPVGTLRMRPGGGSAGQRGLASTIQQLGTQEFPACGLALAARQPDGPGRLCFRAVCIRR